ncbi:MAG: ABC transporter transmembrane domain-containing protein, partial [Candidatus Thorarchaeota archaeon]
MTSKSTTKHRSATRYMMGGLLKHPGSIAVATLFTVISTLLLVLPSLIIGLAIDELTVAGYTNQFTSYVWLIVGLTAVYMVLYFGVGYVWAIVALRWERDARQEFFESLQDFSMTFHDEVDSKRLLSVAMQDISWVRMSLNPAMRNIIGGLTSFVITAIFLSIVDLTPGLLGLVTIFGFPVPMFTIIMLIGTPLYLVYAYKYANAVEPVRRKRSEGMERLTSISQGVFQGIEVVRAFGADSQGVFQGIEVVRAFGAEVREKEKFQHVSKEYEALQAQEGRLAAFYIPALILVGVTAVAFFYGGFAVLSGALTIGTFMQVLTLLVSLEFLNFHFPRMLLMLRGGYVNSQRIVDILNWEEPMIEPEDETQDVDWAGDIVLDNVSFKYSS